ncbi:RNA polymerase sigma factor [Thiospirochaeta perfilievii]|nr:sigma-70 family RNA polymerase sigma factor [Thiospirochaeta perfilievii]
MDIELLYKKYGPMVYRRCKTMLKNEEQATDAMQDVFVQLIRKKDDLTMDAPSSLLYTIATNTCLNIIRKRKNTPECESDEILQIIASYDDPTKLVLTNHFLERLFKSEKSSTKTIAVLHYVDGFTLEETANQVGLSVSGVRKRLRNLREKSLLLKEQ